MRDAVICSPVRTPVGRYGGALKDIDPETLAAIVVEAVLERTKIDPAVIDDSIFGHGYPNGETPAMGRLAVLHAGLPVEVPGFQLDRRCGSGLLAVCLAAMEVQTGVADVVLAGGVESMSQAEFYVQRHPLGTQSRPSAAPRPAGQGPRDRRDRTATRWTAE